MFEKNKYYNKDITEEMVYRYYSSVVSKIIEDLDEDKIMCVLRTDGDIIKKKFKDEMITIKTPEEFDKINTGRMIEIHRIFGSEENFSVVDIDPRPEVPFKKTKEVTKKLVDFLSKKYKNTAENIQIYFSGHRGFHIYINWGKPEKVNILRDNLKKDLEEFLDILKDPKVMLSLPKHEDEIRLDITIFHPGGSIRLPYSLHKETGLASIPVEDITSFKLEDAKINNFIKLAAALIKDEYNEDNPYEGKVNEKIANLARLAKNAGYDIIIFTARILHSPEDLDFIIDVLDQHNIPYDEITYKKKPNIELIIDDKAVNPKDIGTFLNIQSAKLKTTGKPPKGVPKSQFPRITKNYLRYRQFDPKECKSGTFWMKKMKNGNMLVMCTRKDTGKTSVQSKMVKRKETDKRK
jgi:hypothetical protein